MINVKDPPYNAKGDNAADDWDAIQRAILDSAGQVDHTVLIPAGTYIIGTPSLPANQPLVIPSKVKLIGEGIGQTTLRLPANASQTSPYPRIFAHPDAATNRAVLLVNKGNMLWFGTDPFNYSQVLPQPDNGPEPVVPNDDIEIANMTLDAYRRGQYILNAILNDSDCHTKKTCITGTGVTSVCSLSQVSNAYLHDLELRNSGDIGLRLEVGLDTFESGVTNSRFERLWIHHNGYAALSIIGEASDLLFDSCVIEENDNQGAVISVTS